MRLRPSRSCLGILASGVVCLVTANCAMPDLGVFQGDTSRDRPVRPAAVTLVRSPPFTLRWLSAPRAVSAYRVYYRRLPGTSADGERWVLLREVPARADPALTVHADEMPDGVYEIAVSAVGPAGESALHRSTDVTASPNTGWYLLLQRGR